MNPSLPQHIDQLDDAKASAVLASLRPASSEQKHPPADRALATTLRDQWNDAGLNLDAAPSPADGDAARAALRLLAQDPSYAEPIAHLIQGSTPERFDLGATGGVLLVGGLLLALQTRVHIKRDAEGRWSFDIKKDAADTKLLTPLVKKITELISG